MTLAYDYFDGNELVATIFAKNFQEADKLLLERGIYQVDLRTIVRQPTDAEKAKW